jgi:hypothetical protein
MSNSTLKEPAANSDSGPAGFVTDRGAIRGGPAFLAERLDA